MALTNKAATAPATAPAAQSKKGGRTTANADIVNKGVQILSSLSEEERANIGSKSGTLHFQRLLGLASQKSSRRTGPNESKACSTPVAIELVSDEDIQVPVLDVTVNKDTALDPSTIEYRTVKAGEVFNVTYFEFMFLIMRDEYAGLLEANGDPNGAYFSPKLPAFFDGKAKLPTPTINLRNGSVKSTMFDIDVKGPNGWEIKEGYERYAPLLKKATPKRAAGKKHQTPPPVAISLALQEILGLKK